jgi:hypothetical protein
LKANRRRFIASGITVATGMVLLPNKIGAVNVFDNSDLYTVFSLNKSYLSLDFYENHAILLEYYTSMGYTHNEYNAWLNTDQNLIILPLRWAVNGTLIDEQYLIFNQSSQEHIASFNRFEFNTLLDFQRNIAAEDNLYCLPTFTSFKKGIHMYENKDLQYHLTVNLEANEATTVMQYKSKKCIGHKSFTSKSIL